MFNYRSSYASTCPATRKMNFNQHKEVGEAKRLETASAGADVKGFYLWSIAVIITAFVLNGLPVKVEPGRKR